MELGIVLLEECSQSITVHVAVCAWRNYMMFHMKALTGHFRGATSHQLICILLTAGYFPLHSVRPSTVLTWFLPCDAILAQNMLSLYVCRSVCLSQVKSSIKMAQP